MPTACLKKQNSLDLPLADVNRYSPFGKPDAAVPTLNRSQFSPLSWGSKYPSGTRRASFEAHPRDRQVCIGRSFADAVWTAPSVEKSTCTVKKPSGRASRLVTTRDRI
jgi:hypothetical protein